MDAAHARITNIQVIGLTPTAINAPTPKAAKVICATPRYNLSQPHTSLRRVAPSKAYCSLTAAMITFRAVLYRLSHDYVNYDLEATGINRRSRLRISLRTRRKTAGFAASSPSAAAGSSKLQWMRFVFPGKIGQFSFALSQTVMT